MTTLKAYWLENYPESAPSTAKRRAQEKNLKLMMGVKNGRPQMLVREAA